jgi:uncharacterized membrane protein YhaH (DUF805 family)
MSDELNKEQAPEQAAGTTPEPGTQEAQAQQPPYEQPAPGPGQNQGNPYYGGMQQEKMTGILDAYKSYWKNYVNFNDRTSRAGYWWVILVNYIIEIVLYAVLVGNAFAFGAIAATNPYSMTSVLFSMFAGTGVILLIWTLANILPGLGLMVRRLHDINKRWTNIFFILIPFAGPIILIVFMATGTKYPPENRFYNVPKQA